MKLNALNLPTKHFDDYLSFLVEVLELDLAELSDNFMRLKLEDTTLVISKTTGYIQSGVEVGFELSLSEFQSLVKRVNFYYYRKGPSRFLFQTSDNTKCNLIDPDGRMWRFARVEVIAAIDLPMSHH